MGYFCNAFRRCRDHGENRDEIGNICGVNNYTVEITAGYGGRIRRGRDLRAETAKYADDPLVLL